MLHEFLVANREEILGLSRSKLTAREISFPSDTELKAGLPLFLDQLISILRAEKGDRPRRHRNVAASAAEHGAELLRLGLTVSEVVHDYGSICQSVTELADQQQLPIDAGEFQTFNRCLDDAIAQAVTEFERQRDQKAAGPGVTRLGTLALEMRTLLATSMATFEALARGSVGIHGSTGTLHRRSLQRMRVLIDRTLAEVSLETGNQKSERVFIAKLIEGIKAGATLESKDRDIRISLDAGGIDVVVEADQQILASVVANLVQNALKFTRSHGHIKVRAHTTSERVLIDVEDQCGGLPPGKAENLLQAIEQEGGQTGVELGLAISLKGVRASGGDIHLRDLPGSGCVFTVDLPRAPPAV